MRIAFFTDTFIPKINGVVTSVVNSSKILAKKNNQVHIFTIKSNNQSKINLGKNIHISFYKGIPLFNYSDFEMVSPNYIDCLKKIIYFKPEIIHIHTPTLLGWYGLMIAKILKIPKVGTYHTLLPGFWKHAKLLNRIGDEKGKVLAWKYGNFFYNQCDLVIAPSEAIKKELIKNGLKHPIEVISNGVNLNNFYYKNTKKQVDLIYTGRISYEKNIDVVIKAVKIACKKHPKLKMWIIGKGPDEEKIKELIKKLRLNNNIKVKKAVDNEKLVEFYNKARLFVSASTIETEGITLLEAMACGLPILGVEKLAMIDLITNGKNGLKSKPGDAKGFAKNILNLLENKNLMKTMSNNCISISKEFDVNKSVEKLEENYRKLINN